MPRKKEDNKVIQEVSRRKILMAAFELFANSGYAQTTVDRIASRAGVSKGLIYHYFGSKEEILLGLVELLEDQMADFFPTESLSPPAFLRKLIDFSIDFIGKKPQINRLMLALTVQPEVIAGLKPQMQRIRDEWIGVLVSVLTTLGCEDPEQEAYMLLATFDGMALGYLTIGEDYPLEKIRSTLKKKYRL